MYATLKIGSDLEVFDGVPTLKDMQEVVEGYIAPVNLFFKDDGSFVSAYVDDEGILKGSPFNCLAIGNDAQIPLYGNIIFAGVDKMGETVGLTNQDLVKIHESIGLALTSEGIISTLDFRE